MPCGDVRRSHSASFFKVTRRTEEDINQRAKRLREEDNTTPVILVDVPSSATLTEESLEVNNDLLLTENQKGRNTTYLAIKLNRLNNKQARSVSHKDAYKKLQYDPKQTHARLFNDIITRFKNDKLITENVAKGLQVQQPETPKFYTRPEIYKTGNL